MVSVAETRQGGLHEAAGRTASSSG